MDRIVINSSFDLNKLNIDKDSYIIISDDVQAKQIELNIIGCKATIIDMSKVEKKGFNFSDSEVVVIDLVSNDRSLNIVNNKSNVEYNVIDLYDNSIHYSMKEEIISEGALTDINIASVSYKSAVKDYMIYTLNDSGKSINKINCFGIVKDKSLLNYDITSFIKQGAKNSVVKQSSNILLFDEESVGKNNPILLIEENDVKASHGSSIGKIDDDTMFYLCSRGLSKNEATNLICLGKMEHLINKIEDEKIRESLINSFKERMI